MIAVKVVLAALAVAATAQDVLFRDKTIATHSATKPAVLSYFPTMAKRLGLRGGECTALMTCSLGVSEGRLTLTPVPPGFWTNVRWTLR